MGLEIFKFRRFLGSEKMFFTIKLLMNLIDKKNNKILHTVLESYFTNYLVKFLQDRIRPCRVGALRVYTNYHFLKENC